MEPALKTLKLVKRSYLGIGYLHHFKNDSTGELVFIPCTQQEYERLGQEGGSDFNPTLDGYTWVCSEGGTIKVDTPDTVLGKNEYCELADKTLVRFDGEFADQFKFVAKSEVVNDEIQK